MFSLNIGHLIVAFTALFFLVASYAVLLSAFLPSTGIYLLDVLAQDTHYKYFVLLLIPTSSYFVIANWVGWQYFQNS
ncbi:hypothetical protein SCLCIDRAFT_120255 [Scleroderma citrinum Foug A]|uniref:Uncharacterized protein n=1 Tax=Scleroderma citrinum Foug A TaxID=1036808 RepID=A0A0C3E223_9AGAM|nr:hypothetical protein SCLCIDRAFT_120255 [Scleroderma citrinum Foug A]